MGDKKKFIRNILFFIFIIVITFTVIFKNSNFNQIISTIFSVNYKFIILAVISMFMYFFFEALNIRYILNSLNIKISVLSAMRYTLVGFFGSGITPGGGGGQPVEIYYMKKDGIRVSASMITLMIELLSFHLITIFFGLVGLFFNRTMLVKGSIYIFIIGLIVKLVVLIIMLIGLFSRKLSKKIVSFVLLILSKIKYFNTENIALSINNWVDDYNKGALYVKKHKNVFMASVLYTLFQVFMHYSVTFFVYKSLGFSSYSYLQIVLVQAILYVSTASIPLPGAVGISETAFLMIYSTIFGNTLTSAMILQRFITFYLFIIISLIVVIYSTYKRKKYIN